MNDDDMSFEERIRAIAEEVGRSAERMANLDIEEVAESIGVDPVRARQWLDTAGTWLRARAESLGDFDPMAPRTSEPPGDDVEDEPVVGPAGPAVSPAEPVAVPPAGGPLGPGVASDPAGAGVGPAAQALSGASPHPLDLPTEEQGRALSALDSGRWVVEPVSHTLAAHGEAPIPKQPPGLVADLYARDWITQEGTLTVVGRHALRRWLESPVS